jgi:hypothetical protein
MSSNWWFDNQGRNNLAGIPGDPDNPAILPDYLIIDFLINIPIAKQDFLNALPYMTAVEQTRLNTLVAQNPMTLGPFPFNEQHQTDALMEAMNTPGVHDPNKKRR